MENLFKLKIQLFADPGDDPKPPTQEEVNQLLKDLTNPPADPTQTPPADPTQTPPADPTQTPPADPTQTPPGDDPKPPADLTEEEKKAKEEEEKQKSGIAELRKKQKEDAKRLKELEEEMAKFEEEAKTKRERLLKVIKYGIKGETEEEALENLTAYEVKQEAESKGLTEEQIRAQRDLEDRMNKLNEQQREIVFNSRIFNMQKELNLSQEDVMSFIDAAGKTGIDLFTNAANFKDIYERIMPKENVGQNQELLDKIADLEKQLEELKDGKAPGRSPGGGDPKGNLSWLEIIEQAKGPSDK